MAKTRSLFSLPACRCGLCGLLLLLWLPAAAPAQLLARVDPAWSPFYRAPVPQELANLVAEVRQLLTANPARVLQILAQMKPEPGAVERLVLGLRADAAYQLGGTSLLDAQRLYRIISTAGGVVEDRRWAEFMIGTINKGLGLAQEAETALQSARGDAAEPWGAALHFNLAMLKLEGGRHREARNEFDRWLELYSREPGRALVLYLAGECAVRLNDAAVARVRFRQARDADPEVWMVRPEIGSAMTDLLLDAGRHAAAVAVLEQLAAAQPGTAAGGRALLRVGEIWHAQGEIAAAARAYARLLDGAATSAEGREARLRMALLGVGYADTLELTEPYLAYRLFYRPRPVLEEYAAGRDPLEAQRALQGIAELERKEGRPEEALRIVSTVFLQYPESRESGRAYETFMNWLQSRLEQLHQEQRHERVVDLFQGSRQAMGWAPTRDVGAVVLIAAQSYQALRAPRLARELYEEMRRAGTRAQTAEELDVRILYARTMEGDIAALRQWLVRFGSDWRAHLKLARALVAAEQPADARAFFQRAQRLAKLPRDQLDARSERDRLDVLDAEVAVLLPALEARRLLWRALPAGEERAAWESEGHLTAARLRFAAGDYRRAVSLYRDLGELSAHDTYALALAELHAGEGRASLERLSAMAEGEDPVYRELAALHRSVLLLQRDIREML